MDGELVQPGDVAALAEAIERLLADPGRAFAMGRAGREKVERDFSPTVHLERLAVIYDEARARAGRLP